MSNMLFLFVSQISVIKGTPFPDPQNSTFSILISPSLMGPSRANPWEAYHISGKFFFGLFISQIAGQQVTNIDGRKNDQDIGRCYPSAKVDNIVFAIVRSFLIATTSIEATRKKRTALRMTSTNDNNLSHKKNKAQHL